MNGQNINTVDCQMFTWSSTSNMWWNTLYRDCFHHFTNFCETVLNNIISKKSFLATPTVKDKFWSSYMKHVIFLVKWNWSWYFISVCTICLNFEFYFLKVLLWEIYFGVILGNYFIALAFRQFSASFSASFSCFKTMNDQTPEDLESLFKSFSTDYGL